VEQIIEQRSRLRKNAGATCRGQDVMSGVMCGIDAIGFQARVERSESRKPAHRDPGACPFGESHRPHRNRRRFSSEGTRGLMMSLRLKDTLPSRGLSYSGRTLRLAWAGIMICDTTTLTRSDHRRARQTERDRLTSAAAHGRTERLSQIRSARGRLCEVILDPAARS